VRLIQCFDGYVEYSNLLLRIADTSGGGFLFAAGKIARRCPAMQVFWKDSGKM
jgi:hypothetical protein